MKATRSAAWWWHFWAGIITTPILMIASITGAVLVFEKEIKRAIDHEWYYAPPAETTPRQPVDELLVRARAAATEDARITDIYCYADPQRNFVFTFSQGEKENRTSRRVAITPTGQIVATRDQRSDAETFFRTVTKLHTGLLAGKIGHWVVDLVTAWGCVLLITGIIIWVPRSWKTIKGVWSIRFGGKKYQQWRDWHSVPAIYLAAPTLLIMLSGLMFSSGTGQVWRIILFATGGIPEKVMPHAVPHVDPAVRLPDGDAEQPLERAFTNALAVRSDAPFYGFSIDNDDDHAIRIFAGDMATPIGTVIVNAHPGDGGVVNVLTGADVPAHGKLFTMAYGVHVGGIFGLPTQILAVVVCLGLVGMVVSGLVMWLIRRRPGKLAAPRLPRSRRSMGYYAGAAVLAILLPSFGLSVIVIVVATLVCRFACMAYGRCVTKAGL